MLIGIVNQNIFKQGENVTQNFFISHTLIFLKTFTLHSHLHKLLLNLLPFYFGNY